MQRQLAIIVGQRRGQLAHPMEATTIDHHDDRFPGVTEDRHDLMQILPKILRVNMGHDFVEDPRGAVLHSANDMEQYPTGDATPGAIAHPNV
jgi:hypothetical protein